MEQPSATPAAIVPTPDPRIEEYLDHVYAPLVGVVPYAHRQELRAELRAHLTALVESYQELGHDPEVAVLSALRQFGDPRRISRQWAAEWSEGGAIGAPDPWLATVVGLSSFGPATGAALSLMALSTIVRLPVSVPSEVCFWSCLALIALVAPIGAGLRIGLRAPFRPALGAFLSLTTCILPLAILALLPFWRGQPTAPEGFGDLCADLALFQGVLWMPIGCVSALIGDRLRRRMPIKPGPWVLQ